MGAAVPADDLPGTASKAVPADDLPGATTAAPAQPSMSLGERAAEDVIDVGTGLVSGAVAPARAGHALGEKLTPLTDIIPGAGPLRLATQVQDVLLQEPHIKGATEAVEKVADRPAKTPEGRYIKSVSEQVPAALLSEGALPYKIGSAVGAGVGGQGAADLTNNNPYARAIGTIVGGVGGSVAAGRLPGMTTERELTPNEITDNHLMDAGYKLPPAQVQPGGLNSALQGVGGKYRTLQELSIENQETTNKLVRAELGLTEKEHLTEETLDKVAKRWGQAYEDVKNVQEPMRADAQYVDDVIALGDRARSINKDFPGRISTTDVEKLQDMMLHQQFSSRGMVEMVKDLRREASIQSKNYGDAEALRTAEMNRDAADSLEALIERNLQELQYPDLLSRLKEARTMIAKVNDVKAALQPNWDVSERALFRVGQKRPLTGNLALIAKMGGNYEKAVQEASQFGGVTTVNPLEVGIGIASGNPLAAAGGVPALGIATRALQRSPAYQESFVRPGVINSTGQRVGQTTIPDQQLLERVLASPGVLGLLDQRKQEAR